MLVERLSSRNHTSYCFGRCFWLAPPNMNSEIYFLVIVLYFFLFLDLYSTFVDHLCASGSGNAKNRGNCRKEEVVERNTFGPSKIRKCNNTNRKKRCELYQVSLSGKSDERVLSCWKGKGQTPRLHKKRLWGRN